jgi:hypothetical protein
MRPKSIVRQPSEIDELTVTWVHDGDGVRRLASVAAGSMSRLRAALLEHLRRVPFLGGQVLRIEVRHHATCCAWNGAPCCCDPVVMSGAGIDRRFSGPRDLRG